MLIFNLFSLTISIPIMIWSMFMSSMISDMIMIWFLMEINNFMFLMLMISNNMNKKMTFTYLIIQMLSSSLLMLSFSMNLMLMNVNIINMLIMTALMIKLSIPPLHFWMIILSKYMNWMTLSIMLTIQKMIPFYMLYLMNFSFNLLLPFIMTSTIIPFMMMFNLLNFKKMISYSSINQSMWMIMIIFLKHMFWLSYFMFYSMMIMSMSIIMKYHKISHSLNMYSTYNYNILMLFMFMNIASMPPFSFFMFKWLTIIMYIMNSKFKIIIILMITSSLFMLFIYLNMINSLMFMLSCKNKFINTKTPNIHITISINLIISFIIILN